MKELNSNENYVPNYITDSISVLGRDKALTICMEECSELIKSVSKLIRGREGALESVIEEIADVLICIDWLKEILDVSDSELDEVKAYKIHRIDQRLSDGSFN